MTHTLVYPITVVHNAAGHLEIDGCDVVDLVAEFGTPLMIYEEKTLRDQCRRYMEAFASTPDDFEVIYASKAFSSIAMDQLVLEEGLSIDVSSGGEYHMAKAAGFPAERIFFHGNNKTREELELRAWTTGSASWWSTASRSWPCSRSCWRRAEGQQQILLRITPGVEAHTHSYIQTGQVDSKFGFGLADGVALEAIREAMDAPHLDLVGLHAHIGSQIFELDGFRKAIEILVDLIGQAHAGFGFECRYLNVGGGLGIRYTEEDTPSSIDEYATVKVDGVREEMARDGSAHAPGAHRAGPLDRGQGRHHRLPGGHHQGDPGHPHLRERRRRHERQHPAHALRRPVRGMLANKADAPADTTVTVAGKHCESSDILIKDAVIAKPEPGDILVMPATGAYCYAMASNYNGNPRPAVVLVNEGKATGDHRTREVRGPGGQTASAAGTEAYREQRGRHGPGQDRAHRPAGLRHHRVERLPAHPEGARPDPRGHGRRPAGRQGARDRPGQGAGGCSRRAVHHRLRARSWTIPTIDIVVELIGGTDVAFDFVDAAMRKGKNVVTANKQLLANRGQALFNLARDEQRHLRFEASVAGAIPIIKVMRESMIAAELHTVYGIVNGTTNYILTRMYSEEGDYAEILAKAQELGYAEADPTADVGGADAAAKMAILASIAFHSRVTLADVAFRASRTSPWTTSSTPRTSVSWSS